MTRAERINEAKRLFDLLYSGVTETKWGYLWTLDDRKQNKVTYPFDVSKAENRMAMAQKAIELNDNGKNLNVYFGVCLTDKKLPPYQRVNDENPAVLMPALWVDLDVAGQSHASDNLPPDEKTALSFLPFKPSIVVHTGGGLHAYSLLDEPLEIRTAEERDLAQSLNTGYQSMIRKNAGGYAVDSTHQLGWVLRVPGTYNRKFKDNPPLCLIQDVSGIRYSAMELDELVVALPSKKDTRADSFSDNPDYDWARAVRMLEDIDGTTNPVWFRVRLNLKSIALQCGIDDETAFNVFHTWSQKFEKTYKGEEDCRNEWDRTDTHGDANGMGTLVNEAGWNKDGRNKEKAQAFWEEWKSKAEQKYREMREKKKAARTHENPNEDTESTRPYQRRDKLMALKWDSYIENNRNLCTRKTGFKFMDSENREQDFNPGCYLLGANSGIGKTTFFYQLGEQLVKNGTPVLFVSCEMSDESLLLKSVSRKAAEINMEESMDNRQIRRGGTNPTVDSSVSELKNDEAPFFIHYAKNSVEIGELVKIMNRFCADFENEQPVIIIDYLQYLQNQQNQQNLGNDKQKVDHAARMLKKCQQDNPTVTLLIISSFNRASYRSSVSMESFKETGGIEYFADVMWGLQYQIFEGREANTDSKGVTSVELAMAMDEHPRKIMLQCIKNRFGSAYKVYFDYYPEHDLVVESDTRGRREDIRPKRRGKK